MRKYAVKFAPEAARIIAHFQPEVKKLIRASIDEVVTEPFKGDELHMELAGFRSLKPNPAKPEPNKFQMFFSKLDQKKISATPLL